MSTLSISGVTDQEIWDSVRELTWDPIESVRIIACRGILLVVGFGSRFLCSVAVVYGE